MEYAAMSERILRSIENIMKNDPDIEDFTIVPTDDNTRNKSPVLYENHHLGLESWCVKYVYEYVCSKLMKVRKSLAEKRISYSVKDDLNYLIMGALFINPDVNTFWNMRRELVEGEILNYDQELFFRILMGYLSFHSVCMLCSDKIRPDVKLHIKHLHRERHEHHSCSQLETCLVNSTRLGVHS